LHVAATKGEDKLLLVLLEASAQVDACTMKQQTPLMMAARVGSVAVVQALLDHGASAERCSADGETVLHMASGASTDSVLRLLLDRGISLDARTRTGQTALHCASEAGNLPGLRLLLARHGDLEARATNEGATALHTAARKGHAEVVRELIHAGADLEAATTANGYTPLHFTAFTGSSAACSVLLEAKARVDAQVGISGETALHLASMSGHAGVAKHLLAAGATKDAENASGLTPLLMAIMYDQSGTVTPCLLEASANVHATWRLGSTALHEAAQRADATTVAKLLDLKAAVDVQDTHGDRPLHSAAAGGHVETSRVLLERRAAMDAANAFGLTPLHAAAFNDCGDVLSLLLDLGSQALQYASMHCPALDARALGLSAAWADAADATLTPLERRLLVLRDIEKVSPGALIRELARVRRSATFDRRVRSLLVDSDAAVLQKAAVLPAEACQTLCQEVDQKASLRGGRTDSMPEFTLHLSRGELEGLIGKGLVASLFATAAAYRKERGLLGPDKEMEIFLRKYSASTRPWIKMHADIATVTANVALSDEEGVGGQLLGFVGGRIHP
ncbi:ANK3, partial [Symbiodinium sp. KB8]